MGSPGDPKSLRRLVEDMFGDCVDPSLEALPQRRTAAPLRRYLLADLPEDKRLAIEELYFTDDDVFTFLSVVEDELVDDYVSGALTNTDRDLFERNYLNSEERRQRVEIARVLDSVGRRLGGPHIPASLDVSGRKHLFQSEEFADLQRLLKRLLAHNPAHARFISIWRMVVRRMAERDKAAADANVLNAFTRLCESEKHIPNRESRLLVQTMWSELRRLTGDDRAATELLRRLFGFLLQDAFQRKELTSVKSRDQVG